VYPNTPQMCEQIRAMARKKARARRGLEEGEYSRKEAARALGVHKDTLRRWERRGIAKPQWRNQRPIYTAAEIRRLKHLVEEGGISPHPGRAQQKKQRGAGPRKGKTRNRRR
ncbi:MAG: MerR family transcriptional regulator, partial [Armatimonadetes bacterium]|nr:MerR family transcriptional regulator [Armatimonadota bacterium]